MRAKARSKTALQLAYELKEKRSTRRREMNRLRLRIEDLRVLQEGVGPDVPCDETVPVPLPSNVGQRTEGEPTPADEKLPNGRGKFLPKPATKKKRNKARECETTADTHVVDTIDRSAALLQYYSRLNDYQNAVEMAKNGDVQAQLFLSEFSSAIQETLERQWDALQKWDTQNESLGTINEDKSSKQVVTKKLEAEEDMFWEELSQTFLMNRGQSANTEISLFGSYGSDRSVDMEETVVSKQDRSWPKNDSPVAEDPLPSNVVSQTPSEMEDEDDTVLQEFIQRYKELKKQARTQAKRKNTRVWTMFDSMKAMMKEDDDTLHTTTTSGTSSSFFGSLDMFVDDLTNSVRDVASCSTCEAENDASLTVKTTRFVDQSRAKNRRRRQ